MRAQPFRPRERRRLRRLARRSWAEAQIDPFSYAASDALEALDQEAQPIEWFVMRATARGSR